MHGMSAAVWPPSACLMVLTLDCVGSWRKRKYPLGSLLICNTWQTQQAKTGSGCLHVPTCKTNSPATFSDTAHLHCHYCLQPWTTNNVCTRTPHWSKACKKKVQAAVACSAPCGGTTQWPCQLFRLLSGSAQAIEKVQKLESLTA